MQFKCDFCGEAADVKQWGAGDGASVSNDGSPPKGWRTIYTTIEQHDGDAGIETSTSELVHSCPKCHEGLSVKRHLIADVRARLSSREGGSVEK
jgi:hypothetical protein